MKIKLLSFVIRYSLFVIPLIGFSQCPNTPITLSTQAEVDAFTTNYPGCTELQNSLIISGVDIIDLTPLLGITSVIHNLSIRNTQLVDLDGLNNITRINSDGIVTGLEIRDNALLENISALANLSSTEGDIINIISIGFNPSLGSLIGLEGINVTSELYISYNDSLINLQGLNNYNANYDNFYISNNDNLLNLNGLEGLQSSIVIEIINNESLISLDGLQNNRDHYGFRIVGNSNLQSIDAISVPSCPNTDLSCEEYSLWITDNPLLATCNTEFVCFIFDYRASLGLDYNWFFIENNANNCNSIAEIAYNCGLEPNNDECEGAIALTIGETTVAYNEFATLSTQTPSCNDVNRLDVWFTVNSGVYSSLDILAEAGYSIQLWEGDCGSLIQVVNACAEGSLNDIPVTTNTNYYVQIWSDSEARLSQLTTGLFDILVQDGTLSTEAFAFEGFSLYPNPVKKELNLKAYSNINSIAIYNLLGQEVLSSNPNTVKTSISTANLKTGIYLVKVRIGTSEATYKVVKW